MVKTEKVKNEYTSNASRYTIKTTKYRGNTKR